MKEKLLKWSVALSGLVSSGTAFAGDQLAQIPRRTFDWRKQAFTPDTAYDFLADFSNFLITIAAVVVGFAILWSGLVFITAGADQTKVAKAKSIFKNGLIGGIIIFAIGTIIATIEAFGLNPAGFFW